MIASIPLIAHFIRGSEGTINTFDRGVVLLLHRASLADGLVGNLSHAPYDRIIVTAATETVPQPLVQQLAEGGIMILPLGPQAGAQQLTRLTKTSDGVEQETLIGVRFVPLLPGKAREL